MAYTTTSQKLAGAQFVGDPGFFSTLGKIGGAILGAGGKVIPGPVGTVLGAAGGLIAGRKIQQRPGGMIPTFPAPTKGKGPIVIEPGAALPGGRPFISRAVPARRRRRMNVLNPKALRRATRRLSGFQREVKKVEKELRKIAPTRRARPRPPSVTKVLRVED